MGTWTHVMRATSAAHSGESVATAAMRVLTRCMSTAVICDRTTKATPTAVVASQVVAATSALVIATDESDISVFRSAVEALALMESAHDHVEATLA